MEQTKKAGIDFDTWSDVAEKDPKAFEQMRLDAIEACINRAPEGNRERLRRLQWRIDQERRLARTPLGACVRISRMMWQSVLGEGGLRERFLELGTYIGALEKPPRFVEKSAEVLQFARPPRR
jgi:hypothetical protein